MSIISDMIRASVSADGVGVFIFNMMPAELSESVRSISKTQRRRWKKKSIVPFQALSFVWHTGIKFVDDEPTQGMKLSIFLEKLWLFHLGDADKFLREVALDLYIDIVETEIMPRIKKCTIRKNKSRYYTE